MDELIEIYYWIDKEMKFDTWYKVESEAQKNKIIQIMNTGLIPDCEFNVDFSEFRKSKLAFETIVKGI